MSTKLDLSSLAQGVELADTIKAEKYFLVYNSDTKKVDFYPVASEANSIDVRCSIGFTNAVMEGSITELQATLFNTNSTTVDNVKFTLVLPTGIDKNDVLLTDTKILTSVDGVGVVDTTPAADRNRVHTYSITNLAGGARVKIAVTMQINTSGVYAASCKVSLPDLLVNSAPPDTVEANSQLTISAPNNAPEDVDGKPPTCKVRGVTVPLTSIPKNSTLISRAREHADMFPVNLVRVDSLTDVISLIFSEPVSLSLLKIDYFGYSIASDGRFRSYEPSSILVNQSSTDYTVTANETFTQFNIKCVQTLVAENLKLGYPIAVKVLSNGSYGSQLLILQLIPDFALEPTRSNLSYKVNNSSEVDLNTISSHTSNTITGLKQPVKATPVQCIDKDGSLTNISYYSLQLQNGSTGYITQSLSLSLKQGVVYDITVYVETMNTAYSPIITEEAAGRIKVTNEQDSKSVRIVTTSTTVAGDVYQSGRLFINIVN